MMGWISVHRKIREHWLWKDPKKLQWWIDILLEVNHSEKKVLIKNTLITVKRGDSVNSLRTWAKRWKTTPNTVSSFFLLLESDGMITRKSVQVTTHLSVCNYESYQDGLNTTKDATYTQPIRDLRTNNNVNNEKNKITKNKSDKFYKEQHSKYKDKEGFDKYKEFVDCLYGQNENFQVLSNVLKMETQCSFPQFITVHSKANKHNVNWKDILIRMDNWKELNKKNTSVSATLGNWISR